ncbi:protein JTB [Neodiprion pinetum]|uniref:Protein JTB n=1 Tax=Neodiprion lecontei TaxID=441921 RepID=A0A6J0B8C5_NEOLC|nr:protein JTB isoform X1 [Neodiprion lecontei]XP_046484821.1 protein JTB isoform X1 [Neodiprion pinetum]
MIESCTKKRMLIAVTFLGGLTILVLIIESNWTDTDSSKAFVESVEKNSSCYLNEEFDVILECHPCTAFEIASESIGVCIHTSNKEVLKCRKSGITVTRSCDKVAWLEERSFWRFEGLMFGLAVLSCISVYWRENILRQRIVRKVARQLRASV